MRPVRLRVEGFTCFKQAQELDFAGLDLFAISGPTGAGKSSVLDAITYALYGKVPRTGKQGNKELISLGASRMSVCFDFELGGRRYRVTRTGRRQGQGEAQVEEIDTAGETVRPLADGAAKVDELVAQAIGLHYDGFTQAVVLPQGEFAQFLRSTAGKRTELLRELLRMNRYEAMREKAAEKAKEAKRSVETLEQRLREDYAGATAEGVSQLEQEIAARDQELKALRKELSSLGESLRETRRLHERTAELEKKHSEMTRLTAREPEIGRLRQRLEAGEKAAGVFPHLEREREKRGRAAEREEKRRSADQDLRERTEASGKARKAAQEAEKAAKRIPQLDESIGKLEGILELLGPRDRQARKVRDLEKELETGQERLGEHRRERERMERDLEQARKREAGAAHELQEVEYDARLHERVEEILDDASNAKRLREELAEARKVEREAVSEAKEARRAAEAAERQIGPLEHAAEKADHAAAEGERKLREAEQRHAAERLRGELRPGQPCPVCEQPVHTVPKTRKVEAHLDELQEACEQARERAKEKRDTLAQARATAKSQGKAASSAESKAQRATAAAEAKGAEHDLARNALAAWARKAKVELEEPHDAHILRIEKTLRAAQRKHTQGEEALRAAAAKREEAERGVEKLETSMTSTQEKITRARRELDEARQDLQEYERKIRAAAGEEDPRAALQSLKNERAELEEASDEARSAAEIAERELEAAKARLDAAREQESRALEELAAAQAKVKDAVQAAGFASTEAAERAILGEKDLGDLRRRIAQHERERAALEERIAALESELADKRVSQPELEAKEDEHRALSARADEMSEKNGAGRQRLEQLRQQAAKARELHADLARWRSVSRTSGALADELQANRFQEYVLQEAVDRLVKGASVRLRKLSDRYTLTVRNGVFSVADHDNAGEERSAHTLSGGETFLTSLALALELSEQVQSAAGAVSLGSIFIDEGFGTLDPETLETVAGALQTLPVGGRMVGIITHIAELTQQMPGKILIERDQGGSRARVATP